LAETSAFLTKSFSDFSILSFGWRVLTQLQVY